MIYIDIQHLLNLRISGKTAGLSTLSPLHSILFLSLFRCCHLSSLLDRARPLIFFSFFFRLLCLFVLYQEFFLFLCIVTRSLLLRRNYGSVLQLGAYVRCYRCTIHRPSTGQMQPSPSLHPHLPIILYVPRYSYGCMCTWHATF